MCNHEKIPSKVSFLKTNHALIKSTSKHPTRFNSLKFQNSETSCSFRQQIFPLETVELHSTSIKMLLLDSRFCNEKENFNLFLPPDIKRRWVIELRM